MSDPFQVPVCKKCGIITCSSLECQACKTDQVSVVNIPYAAKLLTHETGALLLKMSIKPTEV